MKEPTPNGNFDEKSKKRLQELIESIHEWPSIFMFKFILPTDENNIKKLKLIFGESSEITTRTSKNGKYTSVTVKEMIMQSKIIFSRYEEAGKIKGIIAL